MLPTLEIIPDRRRKLGLTQSQLASLAGVSQSYIAKLEAGKIEPSYIKIKSIFWEHWPMTVDGAWRVMCNFWVLPKNYTPLTWAG